MELDDFEYAPVSVRRRVCAAGDPAAIDDAIDLLAAAERPYVYVGAGCLYAGATDKLVALAELLTLPVATTLNGKSAFPEDHPLSLGVGGFAQAAYGSLPASKFAKEADVILTIGCGFKRHATQKPEQEVQGISRSMSTPAKSISITWPTWRSSAMRGLRYRN